MTGTAPRLAVLARAHAVCNVGGGLWPLLSMRSFEAVTGPKVDRWLVRTVAGLMVANGVAQWGAGRSEAALSVARRVGIGTALTLAAVDVRYAVPRRISRVYLVDAVLESAWVVAWLRSYRRR